MSHTIFCSLQRHEVHLTRRVGTEQHLLAARWVQEQCAPRNVLTELLPKVVDMFCDSDDGVCVSETSSNCTNSKGTVSAEHRSTTNKECNRVTCPPNVFPQMTVFATPCSASQTLRVKLQLKSSREPVCTAAPTSRVTSSAVRLKCGTA